jgi:hypothetical protein
MYRVANDPLKPVTILRRELPMAVHNQILETFERWGPMAFIVGGIGLFGNVYLGVPPLRLGDVAGLVSLAHLLWTVGALLMLALFVLSIAMYRREDAVQARLPLDYVTVTSLGFGALTVLLAGATTAFWLADASYGRPVVRFPAGLRVVADTLGPPQDDRERGKQDHTDRDGHRSAQELIIGLSNLSRTLGKW